LSPQPDAERQARQSAAVAGDFSGRDPAVKSGIEAAFEMTAAVGARQSNRSGGDLDGSVGCLRTFLRHEVPRRLADQATPIDDCKLSPYPSAMHRHCPNHRVPHLSFRIRTTLIPRLLGNAFIRHKARGSITRYPRPIFLT
jgi:hypothetical protein